MAGVIRFETNETVRTTFRKPVNALLIIGQAPSRTSDPDEPLTGRSGRRLADLLGVAFDVVLTSERRNLNHKWTQKNGRDGFDGREAADTAERIMSEDGPKRVVILGAKVAGAFGLTWKPLHSERAFGRSFLMIPHPSGLNRWWNDSKNRRSAAVAFRRFLA